MMLKKLSVLLLGTLLFAAAPVWSKDAGLYVGVSAGLSDFGTSDFDDFDFDEFDEDDSDFAWKVFGGYQFNSFFAVEGGYVDFGTPVFVIGDTDVDGYSAFLVAGIPLGPLRAFVKGGGIAWEADLPDRDLLGNPDDDGTDLAAGAGLEIEVFSFGLRAEVEYFDFGDDTYLYTLGATYTF